MNEIEVIVPPCLPVPFPKKWAGLFKARLGDRLLCTSRQPFLDAARVLVSEGHDPETVIRSRHAGRDIVALTAKLSVAARLTVDESGPHFRLWKAMPPREGSRIIDENGLEAITQHEGLPPSWPRSPAAGHYRHRRLAYRVLCCLVPVSRLRSRGEHEQPLSSPAGALF